MSNQPWHATDGIGSVGVGVEMRERILDGAQTCLISGGFASKRLMSAIARHAGVSRTTLYRYFDNPDQVRAALMRREIDEFLNRATVFVEMASWDAGFFAELTAFIVEQARASPLLGAALRDVPEQVLPMLTINAGTFVAQVDAFARPLLAAQIDSGVFPPVQLDILIDLLVRVALSLIITPTEGVDPDDPQQLRRYLRNAISLAAFIHAGTPRNGRERNDSVKTDGLDHDASER
jgi:AcrR family transcriptional regulator